MLHELGWGQGALREEEPLLHGELQDGEALGHDELQGVAQLALDGG